MPIIQQMSREERAQFLGVSMEAYDKIRAAAMKVGRPTTGAIQKVAPDAKLFDLKQAAQKLGMSTTTLKGHVADGEIRYINTARGKKHRRMMFTEADIEEFIERRAQRDVPCQSTNRRSHRIGNTTSKLGPSVSRLDGMHGSQRRRKVRVCRAGQGQGACEGDEAFARIAPD